VIAQRLTLRDGNGPYDGQMNTGADEFVLDTQLCFALHNASRAMTACYRPLLSQIGLTYTQYVVMLVLWERQRVLFRELTDALEMDSATLSPLLKRLAEKGLVERNRNTADERMVEVELTPSGEALRESARAIQAQVVRSTGLSSVELASMRAELHVFTDRLRSSAAVA